MSMMFHGFNEKLLFSIVVGQNVCASRVLRLRMLNLFWALHTNPHI